MRIFYASDTTPNASFQSQLWRNNLYLPLVDLGHDVWEFDYDLRETFQNLDPSVPEQKAFIKQNRPKVTEELLKQVKAAHALKPLDLFFSYFYDACVLPRAIDEIRAMGIKTVNWYCNGSYQLHLASEISPHYDWCLVPEKFRLKDYREMGARPVYCQEAANPNIYKPFDVPVEYDVAFVGQAYGDRPDYIRHLLDEGIDVRVWGVGWPHYAEKTGLRRVKQHARKILKRGPAVLLPQKIMGGPLSDVEMIKMYSRAKINIGFSTCGNTHLTGERIMQVRLRDFEVPMSGGFYMVEYMEELEEFFKIGEEIVCYTDARDLSDKVKYYLQHKDEREAIRRAGHERARRDHTWHKRFETAFAEMGLN